MDRFIDFFVKFGGFFLLFSAIVWFLLILGFLTVVFGYIAPFIVFLGIFGLFWWLMEDY